MGELVKYHPRRSRHLAPQSRRRVDRLRLDADAYALVKSVARARGISMRALLEGRQSRGQVGISRQLAMYLVHVLLGRTQEDVGVLFCRAHTTVSYACRSIELLRDDAAFEAEVEQIEAEVLGQRVTEVRRVA